MFRTFIREKKIYCGKNYMEVDIYPYTETQVNRKKRSKKEKESNQFQKNLNDKNAKRKFIQLAETNFTEKDYFVTLTYSPKHLPKDQKTAEKEVANFLDRVRYHRKKAKLPQLKYLIVTEYAFDKDGNLKSRPHHHILMNSGLSRDEIEDLWTRKKKKGQKKKERIGIVTTRRLMPDDNTGIESLAEYFARHQKMKKKYSCSKNLIRPESRTNDHKYSRRKLIKMAQEGLNLKEIEKLYKGWTIKDKDGGFQAVYNDMTGWSIYLKLRRKD